jgi:spermidine synthase
VSERNDIPLPLLSIACISCAALGMEILLMRLFAIVQWHHFAYLAVSLALLGYGVAGTALTVAGDYLRDRVPQAFVASALLFGLSAPLAFLVAQQVPFNALEILWDYQQWLWLAFQSLVLLVPFFFAAVCLCLVFSHYGGAAPRIYNADLWGAGAGASAALGLLFLLPPQRVLLLLAGLAIAAAALAWRNPPWAGRLLLVLALTLPWVIPPAWLALQPSPYKSLTQALLLPGARVIAERHSPLGTLTLVESPQVPLRHAPGLSLAAQAEPMPQLGLFVDGDGPAAITRDGEDAESLAFLGQMPTALPYHLRRESSVLVLGAGTGMDVLQALYHGAAHVDAVELNAQLAVLVRDGAAQFSGDLYRHPRVALHQAEARSFLARNSSRYDLIVLPLASSPSASAAGLYGMSEDYLHTHQAMQAYLRHLQPHGMLVFNRWLQLPPRDLIKLTATAMEVLEHEGASRPLRQLALLRSWQSATLLVKNSPFTAEEIAAMQAFAKAWSFDLEWAGGPVEGANTYHRLQQPYFVEAFTALGSSQREDFYRRYKFDIRPTDDDRPYFNHFFLWRSLPEILALRERGGLPLLEMGYPVLLATWLQALVLSALLILLPLRLSGRHRTRQPVAVRGQVFAYFSLLGTSFMLLEIAFMQKLVLLLGHPLYAAAAVLTLFLLCAGLGSRMSAKLAYTGHRLPLRWPVAAIVLWGGLCLAALPLLTAHAMGWPLAMRLTVVAALVAPLAFCMGMPFPLGLRRLADGQEMLLPWAFGVNACFSVMGAPLAVLLAIAIGFEGVVLVALALYVAAMLMSGWKQCDELRI